MDTVSPEPNDVEGVATATCGLVVKKMSHGPQAPALMLRFQSLLA